MLLAAWGGNGTAALGTLPAETLWRRDRRILSHRAWMMLSASRRPGVGCDLF